MQTEEIIKMCKSLARRYKNYTEYEDLVSEGILAIYERLEKEPYAPPVRLYRVASTRMHDYMNLDTLPVTVPASDVARRLARDKDAEVDSTWSPEAVEHLRAVLTANRSSDDEMNMTCPSSEDLYIKNEQEQLFVQKLEDALTDEEQFLVYMRFNEGMTQEECGQFWGKSRQWMTKAEKEILYKVERIVLSLQQ